MKNLRMAIGLVCCLEKSCKSTELKHLKHFLLLTNLFVCQHFNTVHVFVAKDLSPQVQVNNVVSRAHKRAAAILRAFVSRDVNLLMRAFPCQTHCGVQHYNLVTVDCAWHWRSRVGSASLYKAAAWLQILAILWAT